MATDSWINETLYPDWGQRFLVKRELARVQSDFQDIVIFDGQIAPGKHSLTSHVVYQGRSRSIFTYMKGYTFNLDSTHELDVAASGATSATIIGKPNKGFNVPFEKSLGVEMTQTSGSTGPSAKQVSTGFSSPGR